ncbi:unnamed protein product [Calicophoron daubneyi]|uniref:Uncharacterized protein n=1 Tax=Calicophoron daubneyi TaxID=300641 RepID=A0AAV2TGP0_CALDB
MEDGIQLYRENLRRFSGLFSRMLYPASDADRCSAITPPSPSLESLSRNVVYLFNKQEYFRQAYNATLDRLCTLTKVIPEYAHPYLCNQEETRDDSDDVSSSEDEDDLSPEMIDFFIQTMQHRQRRDCSDVQAAGCNRSYLAPPLKKDNVPSHPISNEISAIETAILHHYEYSSCRDAPFWPHISLRNLSG